MKRITLLIVLITLVVLPAAAQTRLPVPDITRYADYAPSTAVVYAAIRMDTGFREQTDALLNRLEPLIGETEIEDFFDDVFNEDDIFPFIGDGMAITVLSSDANFDNLLEEDAPVAITFGIKDIAMAREFLGEGNDGFEITERNGWIVYEADGARALLRGDVMIISPDIPYTDQVISGDYGKLTADAEFIATLDRLPVENYDLLAYADLETLVSDITTRADRASADATAGLLGHVALGGVSVGGQDLLLDVAWRYGDLTAMREYGFDPESLTASPVDLDFAARVPADTQIYAQSTGFGGLLRQTFDLLNVFGGLMENDASTEFFGLDSVLNASTGDTLKAAAALGLAAATGLNLDTDVIDTLEGDFALYLGFSQAASRADILPSMGLLLTESGQGETFSRAFVNTLDRAGYPINRIPLRGAGEAIDLSPLTDPLMFALINSEAAASPGVDVWFGAANGVMSLGTAPAVRFALTPGDESLASTPEFQHAAASTFLPDAVGIFFVNVGGLSGVADMPDLTDTLESLSASATSDLEGVTGRLAVTLK